MNDVMRMMGMEVTDLLKRKGCSMSSPEIAEHLGIMIPSSCRSGYDTQPQLLAHAALVYLEAQGVVVGNYGKPVMWRIA